MNPEPRTYAEILRLQHALSWLGNQRPGEKAKTASYNALNLRLQLVIEAYKPLFTAIESAQRSIFLDYTARAGDELKNLDNGNVTFGVRLDQEYQRELEQLLEMPAEDEPRRKPFKLSDFDLVGIAVPQKVMDGLGSLLEKPSSIDPDAITDEEDPG